MFRTTIRIAIAKRAMPFLSGALLAAVVTYGCVREPNADYDPQAASTLFCDDYQVRTADNGAGLELRAHTVNCDVFGNSTVTYVDLGPRGQRFTRVNLVLRYEGDDPQLGWLSENEAFVKEATIGSISKQVTRLFGVDIAFHYGRHVDHGHLREAMPKP